MGWKAKANLFASRASSDRADHARLGAQLQGHRVIISTSYKESQ